MQSGNAFVTGFGAFLPNDPVDNDAIERILGQVNNRSSRVKQRILTSNGIMSRHYAIDAAGAQTHTNAQLTGEAVRALAKTTGFDLQRLECLACGTSAADQIIPSHGSMVHAELGIPACEVVTLAGVCCAGMGAFKYGWLNVASGNCASAVVTGSDLPSPTLTAAHFRPGLELQRRELDKDPTLELENDFLRWMLSDGAGALLIEREPDPNRLSLRIDWLDFVSYAHETDVCMFFGLQRQPDGSTLGYRSIADPMELFRNRVLNLGQDVKILQERMLVLGRKAIARMQRKRALDPERIRWFLPHYSSKWFRQSLYDALTDNGLTIPYERWFTNLPTKGNTGAASIYIILEELASSNQIQSGDSLLCFVPESARMSFAFLHMTAV